VKDPNAMECRTASNLARGIEDARNAACGTQAHSLNKTMYCVGSVGSMSVLGVCGWEHRGCHGAGMTVVEWFWQRNRMRTVQCACHAPQGIRICPRLPAVACPRTALVWGSRPTHGVADPIVRSHLRHCSGSLCEWSLSMPSRPWAVASTQVRLSSRTVKITYPLHTPPPPPPPPPPPWTRHHLSLSLKPPTHTSIIVTTAVHTAADTVAMDTVANADHTDMHHHHVRSS